MFGVLFDIKITETIKLYLDFQNVYYDLDEDSIVDDVKSLNVQLKYDVGQQSIDRFTNSIIKESETSSPASIIDLTRLPNSEPSEMAERSISPVDICGIPYRSHIYFACVPFPAPGGPNKINFILSLQISLPKQLSIVQKIFKCD